MTKEEIAALLERPTITPDELLRTGIFPLSRNAIYRAIDRGEIDAIKISRRKAVVTAPLRKKLGLD